MKKGGNTISYHNKKRSDQGICDDDGNQFGEHISQIQKQHPNKKQKFCASYCNETNVKDMTFTAHLFPGQ
jgi:hypothetical protein